MHSAAAAAAAAAAAGDTCRKDKGQIYTFLNAMLNQYDNEDFDLGIKQFLIEQVGPCPTRSCI
jgi:hypothetical protein